MISSNDIFPLFPEILSVFITITAAVVVFRIAIKLNVIFRKGFLFIGTGMAFLSITAIASSLHYISLLNQQYVEVVFEAAMLAAALCILKGASLIYGEIVGDGK